MNLSIQIRTLRELIVGVEGDKVALAPVAKKIEAEVVAEELSKVVV